MNTALRVYPLPRWFGRSLLLGAVAWLAALPPSAAWGQGSQTFYCQGPGTQAFQVPAGITALTTVVQGAHGAHPSDGAAGGFGGLVQATLAVTPGQELLIWVGCIDQKNKVTWGFGSGGNKGIASNGAAEDGGFGGGGSAVTTEDLIPLLVAGGGGGGGGAGSNSGGGTGGNGGIFPEAGKNGNDGTNRGGGEGGCARYPCNADIDGGDGEGASTASSAGDGGGGGGGAPGGGGGLNGEEPLQCCQGAGGGGGGQSYAERSATQVTFGTSSLAADGLVTLSWPVGAVVDLDADGVPDQVDQCGSSDQSSTVAIDACDSGAENDLDVDGCTIADRVAEIADAATHGQFVRGVVRLTRQLQQQGYITRAEQVSLLRCAVQAEMP